MFYLLKNNLNLKFNHKGLKLLYDILISDFSLNKFKEKLNKYISEYKYDEPLTEIKNIKIYLQPHNFLILTIDNISLGIKSTEFISFIKKFQSLNNIYIKNLLILFDGEKINYVYNFDYNEILNKISQYKDKKYIIITELGIPNYNDIRLLYIYNVLIDSYLLNPSELEKIYTGEIGSLIGTEFNPIKIIDKEHIQIMDYNYENNIIIKTKPFLKLLSKWDQVLNPTNFKKITIAFDENTYDLDFEPDKSIIEGISNAQLRKSIYE